MRWLIISHLIKIFCCLQIQLFTSLVLKAPELKIAEFANRVDPAKVAHNQCNIVKCETNRTYHLSLMQTEKYQSKGKRIMPEMRFTNFLALSVDQRVGISWSASETDD